MPDHSYTNDRACFILVYLTYFLLLFLHPA